MNDCPNCEYHRQRAQLWRDEAYKQAGHPLPEQEPVAWISATELLVMRGNALGGAKDWRVNLGLEPEEGDVGLYTTPPQRKPLSDEDLRKLADKHLFYQPEGYEVSGVFALARAIEAAHGIKGEA